MPRTLYAKLSLLLVTLLLGVGVTYLAVSFAANRHYRAQVDQELNRGLAHKLVADRNLVAEGRIDKEAVKSTFEEYMAINPSIEIYLLDLEGNILTFSADPGKVKRRQVSMAPIRTFLQGDDAFPLLGDDPRSHDKRKAFSVTPVPSDAKPEGYLYVVLRGERYDALDRLIEESYFARLSAWAVAASLAVGLGFGLLMFHLLTRRLQRLSGTVERFRESGLNEYEPYAAAHGSDVQGDEIDSLGHNFDRMAQRIAEQVDALERQDALRRDLVAQVSHDLRTPLAILHGHLEMLSLEAERGTGQTSDEHMRVALGQSERLRRLVSDLFELAKLEAREEKPAMEPFAAAELAHDVAQKFALKAEHQRKQIHVQAPANLPMAVGDLALIERVLDNLIDNALQHTNAGGNIALGLSSNDDRIKFTVADDGPGIAAGQRERVFERFTQAPRDGAAAGSSRGDGSGQDPLENDDAHVGLGLAIARRIVRLHGGQLGLAPPGGLDVIDAAVYTGAAFQFSIPAS